MNELHGPAGKGEEPVGGERDFIQSIERGFAVLTAFDADSPRPTLLELSRRTGLSRPAVRRILLTLQRLGYVAAKDGHWALTPRVLTIGQHYNATQAVVETAQPHLLSLVERTGESASLAQLDGTDVIYIARVSARRVLSINVDIGTRLPVHATSMGRVLAAWADAITVENIIDAGLPRLTDNTITDPIAYRDALHQVRHDGYAVVDGELEAGFLSAAAPIRDRRGGVIAAVACSTSSGRTSRQELERDIVPALVESADRIGRDLELVLTRGSRLGRPQRDGFF